MLEIRNVSKIYGDGATEITALDSVSLQVNRGEFLAIMGPSGSGKTTLLNIIGGLDYLSDGEIILDGLRIDNLDENGLVAVRRGKIAYIFQQYHLLPSLSALENILLPLTLCGQTNSKKKALEMLSKVGLEKRADHKPDQLSGGEQQRVAIARALISEPLVMLADEPTGNMDGETGRKIIDLFKELNRAGHTIVMVTHDPEIAGHAGKIVVLQDGKIIR